MCQKGFSMLHGVGFSVFFTYFWQPLLMLTSSFLYMFGFRLLLSLLLLSPCLRGQSALPMAALTIKDGLSQGMIFDIVQTSDGFMWFGTKDGLNRYDGYHFTVFRHTPADSFSLADNTVTRLFEDRQQRLWAKTRSGVDVFDPRTQRFRHIVLADAPQINAYREEMADIKEDPAGNIWVSSGFGGLFRISLPAAPEALEGGPATLSPRIRLQKITLPPRVIVSEMLFAPDGTLFLAALEHSFRLKPGQTTVEHIHPNGDTAQTFAAVTLMLAPDNSILLLGPKGACRVRNNQAGPVIATGLPANINRHTLDQEGFVWLSAVNQTRLLRFPLQNFNSDEFYKNIITYTIDNYPTSIYTDRTGNLWMGTNGYGIRQHNPRTRLFNHVANGHTVGRLRKDMQGNVYFRQFKGFFKVTPPHYDVAQAAKLTRGLEFDVLPAPSGNLWLLTSQDSIVEGTDNVLSCLNPAGKVLWTVPAPFPLYIKSMLCRAPQGEVWFNTARPEVVRFNPETRQLTPFSFAYLFDNQPSVAVVLYADAQNTLWVGTNKGLLKGVAEGSGMRFHLIRSNAAQPNGLPVDGITSFCDDPAQPDRFIWVGTNGGGLVKMDKQTGSCLIFSEKQGLPNAVVYGILPDDQGNLWVSTNRGLARFTPKTAVFHTYTHEDGLQDDEFNTHAFFRTPQGELLFGGVNGFNLFFSSALRPGTTPPFTAIVDLKVNNQSLTMQDSTLLLTAAPHFAQTITLPYTHNYLSFSFAALDFTNVRKNNFKYLLEGADRDWVMAGNQPVANYTALPPGTYTFRVVGCNADGVWSLQPATLTVVIKPPFWRTTLAYLLYVLALGFAAYKLYQHQIQRIKLANQLQFEQKEATRLAALDELKTRFFANVTHELRTPLSLILEPARRLGQALRDTPHQSQLTLIEKSAQKLLQLVNQLLDLSKLEGGMMQVTPEYGNITEAIQPIYDAFSLLAQQKAIIFAWNHPEIVPPFAFDRDKIEKILNNLLSNAFKFTPDGGKIILSTQLLDQQLLITVKDTGIGMDAHTLAHIFSRFYQADNTATRRGEGTGIGLALVRELVELLGGKVTAQSLTGEGSTFVVSLPVQEAVPNSAPAALQAQTAPPNLPQLPPTPERDHQTLILVVEDNDDMRAFLCGVMKEAGYQVVSAENGVEGIEKAFALLPDFIISDVMMPEKDGFELTHTLKTDLRTSHIPIMLLSARSAPDSRLAGLRTGADEYLPKPFNTEEVLLRVRNLTDRRTQLQAAIGRAATQEVPASVGTDPAPLLSEVDSQFLDTLAQLLDKELDNDHFEVEILTQAFGLSRSQLHRKLVALTGQSVMEYVRNYRLDKALTLLRQRTQSVADVAWATGFKDPKHFSTAFRKRFGQSPSEV